MLTQLCASIQNKLCCAGGIRISLSAANAMLQGQSEAFTNETGIAYVDSLIFGAIPGDNQLELSMPDYYPLVLSTPPQAMCIMANGSHARMHMHMLTTSKS